MHPEDRIAAPHHVALRGSSTGLLEAVYPTTQEDQISLTPSEVLARLLLPNSKRKEL